MITSAPEHVKVGLVTIPLPMAQRWVATYTDTARNTESRAPYAFPAYDRYDGGTIEPTRLTDGDLLAPGLLNVPVKIRSFYGLQRIRPLLEEALANPVLALPLGEVADRTEVASVVTSLYRVLDDEKTKPWGVNATTLSKVLHRKRPQSLALHDSWVRACYVGTEAVPRADQRTWAAYMVAITHAIAADLRNQRDTFTILDAATSTPGELSYVRLIDILAWTSKGQQFEPS